MPVSFGDAVQMFHVGAASVGTFGMPAGVCEAARRFGRFPLERLVAPAARLAREGVPLNPQQAYIVEILGAIVTSTPEAAALFAPDGRLLRAGDRLRQPELGDALERLGTEGARPFYEGDIAAAIVDWLAAARRSGHQGGPERLRGGRPRAGPRPLPRPRGAHQPAAVGRRHPHRPCAGDAGRSGPPAPPSVVQLVDVMESTQNERTPEFLAGLGDPRFVREFLARPVGRLGSTTHIAALDRDGLGVLGHVLQRLGIRRHRARHRCTPQQHARRAGPQPPRLSPPPARPADAEHDVPDDRPARRDAPSWRSAAPAPTGSARRCCRRSSARSTTAFEAQDGDRRAAGALRGRHGLHRARDRRRPRWRPPAGR